MAIEVKKRSNESPSALLYRFTKKVKHSGILNESRKRRFHTRPINRVKRRASAIHRARKKAEVERMKKLGLL